MSSHQFALWMPTLSVELTHNAAFIVIDDHLLITRLKTVLRLRVNEQSILFDRAVHAFVTCTALEKKRITMRVETVQQNHRFVPRITMILPLLKKDTLSTAIYDLTACGVSDIQLTHTAGVQRKWGGSAELERLERVAIAAAEQAKQYIVPVISIPKVFEIVLASCTTDSVIIFFDPAGMPLEKTLHTIPTNVSHYYLIVGPEADLIDTEKELLQKRGALFCALTPTVLRTHLAATLGVAMMRSWWK
jgi:RsmE family RNA methyltransferase